MRYSLLLMMLAASAPASAFEDPLQFFNAAEPHAATYGASAEGVYFTGAPRFTTLNSSSCHTSGPGQVRLKLGADHPELFSRGYVPGQSYLFEVELLGETLGLQYKSTGCTEPPGKNDTYPYQQCNSNGFALEIDSADGTPLAGNTVYCAQSPAGGVCPAPNGTNDEVLVAPDGDAVFGVRQYAADNPNAVLRNDPTDWHLWWTAPAAGFGPVTIYVAAVDGNGGSGTPANDQDPFGDDTVQASFSIQEAGTQVPGAASAGCSTTGGPGAVPVPLLLLFALGLFWSSRIRIASHGRLER